jgi:hypothetical protein
MRRSEALGPRSESLDPGGRACASWGERSSSRVVSLLSVGGGGSPPAFRGRRAMDKGEVPGGRNGRTGRP